MNKSSIDQLVYDTVCLFQKEGRDATKRRIATHLLRGFSVEVTLAEIADRQEQIKALVGMSLKKLEKQGRIRHAIDAWVPCKGNGIKD